MCPPSWIFRSYNILHPEETLETPCLLVRSLWRELFSIAGDGDTEITPGSGPTLPSPQYVQICHDPLCPPTSMSTQHLLTHSVCNVQAIWLMEYARGDSDFTHVLSPFVVQLATSFPASSSADKCHAFLTSCCCKIHASGVLMKRVPDEGSWCWWCAGVESGFCEEGGVTLTVWLVGLLECEETDF